MAEKTSKISTEDLVAERDRVAYRQKFRATLRSTVFILITTAAAAVLIATLVFPIFRIVGDSMDPTLGTGNIVVGIKDKNLKQGDLISFYYNNRVLVKRVIATEGQWVNITEDGTVYVDEKAIDEPYLTEKSLGYCDIDLPYQVPDDQVFVMGDNRKASMDSRVGEIGCIDQENIAGKLVLRIWPMNRTGLVK